MCNINNCTERQWIDNANNFLRNSNRDEKYYTVEYLLTNNHCGRSNRTTLGNVLEYVNNNTNSNISRAKFQHQVLIPLKQQNIIVSLVYPGRQGGIFIPCSIDEVKEVYRQVLDRILSELTNIENAVGHISNSNVQNLKSLIINEKGIL